MDEKQIAEQYDLNTEELKQLDQQVRENLRLGNGDLITGINLIFPELNNTQRAKVFILYNLAKHI